MKVIIDTSSLISLVRYYLPFDKNNILFDFIKNKIELGEILILDAVLNECRYTSKGIVIDKLPYINQKKYQTKTDNILPTKRFFNLLENNFINTSTRDKLSDVEFENRKNKFLTSADAKLILYSMYSNSKEKIVIVTEETASNNDNKSFKKIPAICKILNLEILTLPQLLEKYDNFDIEFKRSK